MLMVWIALGFLVALLVALTVYSLISHRRRQQHLSQINWNMEAGGHPVSPSVKQAEVDTLGFGGQGGG